MLRREFVLAALVSPLVLGACRSAVLTTPTGSARGLTAEQLKQCILTAGTRREWKMDASQPGKIVATQTRRGHVAVCDIAYDDKGYKISLNKATTLVNPDGTVHVKYNQWVNNLRQDIDQEIQVTLYAK